MIRICKCCDSRVALNSCCGYCTGSFNSRPKASTMFRHERIAEMEKLRWLEAPFTMTHKRIEELVGRPVWTHEMVMNWKGLVTEAGSYIGEDSQEFTPAKMREIIDLVPENKRVIIAVT